MHMAKIGEKETALRAFRAANLKAAGGGLIALAAKIEGAASRRPTASAQPPKPAPAIEAKNPTSKPSSPPVQPTGPATPEQQPAPPKIEAKKPDAKPARPAKQKKPAKGTKKVADKTAKPEKRSKYLPAGKSQPRGAFTADRSDQAIDLAKRKTGVLATELKKLLGWNAKRVNRFFNKFVTPLCKLKVAVERVGADTRYTIKS